MESFFGKFKEEEVWLKECDSIFEAEESSTKWIYKYNYERIHSSLSYLTPAEFKEERFKKQASEIAYDKSLKRLDEFYNREKLSPELVELS